MHHISCRVFFCKTSNPPGDSTPLQPRFGALWLLTFPKIKITFKREEISDHRWHSGKYDGVADGDWENCMRSQGAYVEGDWGVIVLCTMFLISCIFFNICLYFSYYMSGYLLDRPHTSKETWNTHSKEYMHPYVHRSIIHNSQDLEAAQVPIGREWIKRWWYIYTMECYSAIKKGISPFATA